MPETGILTKAENNYRPFLICYIAHYCPGSFRYGFSKQYNTEDLFNFIHDFRKLQKYLIENT